MRKSILSLIFSVLLTSMGLTTSSNAVSVPEGLGIGFSLGTAGYYATGQEFEDNPESGVSDGGDTKETGAFQHDLGSIFIEYTAGPVIFGLDYHLSDINTPANTNVQGGSTNTAKATFENLTTAYIAIPVFHALYLKAGVIYVDILTNENLETGGAYANTDTTGYTVGFGLSKEIQNGVSIRGELLAAQYEDVSMTNSNNVTTSVKVTDMYGASGRVSIVKTF